MRNFFLRRRQRGHTLVEVSIATGVLVVLLGLAVPVFKTVGDAGDAGSSRLTAQTENQRALLALASELQNGSTTEADEFGNPRLLIATGADATPLVSTRNGDMGGFKGTLGSHSWGGTAPTAAGADDNTAPSTGTFDSHEGGARGAGQVGTSQWGRDRSASKAGTKSFQTAAVRPRYANIAQNSVLSFQKITGYTVGADGSPELVWGPAIVYRITGNKLTRTQGAQVSVVANYVAGFRCAITDTGTVTITLVTQKMASATGEITYQANQVEVSPKN